MSTSKYAEDEDAPRVKATDGLLLKEFECPGCNAHNPCDEKISKRGVEIRCHYCGVEFKFTLDETGRVKIKEA